MSAAKISIIVCSINEKLRNNLLQNIKMTIGCDFEFLYEDNTIKKDGLTLVYNRLAEKSQGNFLCFCHEDFELKTHNWGCLLAEFATDSKVGIIGFAGSPAATGYPWWDGSFSYRKGFDPEREDADSQSFSETLLLDGQFLFVRKDVWKNHPFDEITLKGFHFYDMDFSLSVYSDYRNYICSSIDYFHCSKGNINKDYFEQLKIFNQKWANLIPFSIYENVEFQSFRSNKRGIKSVSQYLVFQCKKSIYDAIKYVYAIRKKYILFIIVYIVRLKIEYKTGLYSYIYEKFSKKKSK
jgi:hypothetical protein